MLGCQRISAVVRLAGIAAVLAICADAQDLPPIPLLVPGVPAVLPTFGGPGSFTIPVSEAVTEAVPISATLPDPAPPPSGPRRITLQQVQQSANRAASALQRLNMLSVEAARQHRLGVQADYFPKFGATFWNLHTTDFLGHILAVRRSFLGVTQQIPIAIVNQNQTAAALTFVQPITPILQVHQAVRIARADERIAMAKAGAAVAENNRSAEVEETYFQLLIAQRQLISAEWKLRGSENRPLYAGMSISPVRQPEPRAELVDARKGAESAAARVKELSVSLNRIMGWPEETELDLQMPDPLVENISLQDVSDPPVAANLDVVEAEQTVVKARAAETLSKLAYVPTVAAVSGYAFQNVLPSVLSNFGYGGVMASYTLFDFGKREHAIKEARAQREMAELALQLTKAKVAASMKKSYFELEQSRQLSQVAQKMGASLARVMNGSSIPETNEVEAARADIEIDMLEADLAHRQALARLKALIDQPEAFPGAKPWCRGQF